MIYQVLKKDLIDFVLGDRITATKCSKMERVRPNIGPPGLRLRLPLAHSHSHTVPYRTIPVYETSEMPMIIL